MPSTPTATATVVGLLLLVLLVAAGSASAVGASGTSATALGPDVEPCAIESPEDYATPEGGDAIGYVDGYWYDQPIVIAPDDNGTSGGNGTSAAENGTDDGNGTATDGKTTAVDGSATAADGNATADGANRTGASDDSTTGNATENGTATGENESTADASKLPGTPIDASDGLSDRELSAVVARTAARVEALRCRSFESVPSVQVRNRSTVRENQFEAIANRSPTVRRFDGARLSTALLLGSGVNTTEARAATTATATLGYYDPATDSIVVVTADGNATNVDEPTLAHELVHALQDQHFDLRRFDANLTDAAFAESALIEGDASLVGHRYHARCDDGDWANGCLQAGTGAGGNSEYLGLELYRFQPYNEGPTYAEALYAQGGWEAVDARYDDPPSSMKQLLYPTTSTAFQPANVTFEPVADPAWQRVDPAGQPAYDVLGPGTIGAAVLSPTFDAEGDNIYSAQHVTNYVGQSTLDPLQPYDYAVDATSGWEGGRLEVYRSAGNASAANRTATRWRTEWESPTAAATFRERYVELLQSRGAASSRNFVGTYHFQPENSYGGRYSVRQNGTTVTVVHGPDLAALRALNDGAAREPREGSSSSMSRISASKEAAEDALTVPGALGAAVGILLALGTIALVSARRR